MSTTKYIVDNKAGQTIDGNPIDPKYKVYTALVSQDGSSSVMELTGAGGKIDIGVTYEIFETAPPAEGFDFTNVGAPNNNIGTFFVATGTTANSWGNNNVGLRYNEGAPVAIALENTIGNIYWTYATIGKYVLLSDNLFTNNKTFINGTSRGNANVFNRLIQTDGSGFSAEKGYILNHDDASNIVLRTLSDVEILADDVISNPICIEIRVYN